MLKMSTHTLPEDSYSRENAAIVSQCAELGRWIVLIDPNGHALPWLRTKLEDEQSSNDDEDDSKTSRAICEVNISQRGSKQMLIQRIEDGSFVILRGVTTNPSTKAFLQWLRPLICCEFTEDNMVTLGHQQVLVSSKFRLVLVSENLDVRLDDFVYTSCSIVRWNFDSNSLREMLLSMIARKERADLAETMYSTSTLLASHRLEQKRLYLEILNRVTRRNEVIAENKDLTIWVESKKRSKNHIDKKVTSCMITCKDTRKGIEQLMSIADRATMLARLAFAMRSLNSNYATSLNLVICALDRAMDMCRAEIDGTGGLRSHLIGAQFKLDKPLDPIDMKSYEWGKDILRACRLPTPSGQRPVFFDRNRSKGRLPTNSEIDTLCKIMIPKITETMFEWLRRGLDLEHRRTLSYLLCAEITGFDLMNHLRGSSADNNDKEEEAESNENKKEKGKQEEEKERNMSDDLKKWLSETQWQNILSISREHKEFENLCLSMNDMCEEWEDWVKSSTPEEENEIPIDLEKSKISYLRLILIDALRPDRYLSALDRFVRENLGEKYVRDTNEFDLKDIVNHEASSTTTFINWNCLFHLLTHTHTHTHTLG